MLSVPESITERRLAGCWLPKSYLAVHNGEISTFWRFGWGLTSLLLVLTGLVDLCRLFLTSTFFLTFGGEMWRGSTCRMWRGVYIRDVEGGLHLPSRRLHVWKNGGARVEIRADLDSFFIVNTINIIIDILLIINQ